MDPTANTPVLKHFSKVSIGVIVGLVAILLLALALLPWSASLQMDAMRRGFEEGFPLHGMYAQPDQPSGTSNFLSLQVGEAGEHTGIWQLGIDPEGHETHEGFFEETDDPNIYLLFDDNGSEAGCVHLAYANTRGEGVAYLQYGSDTLKLEKVESAPAFFRGPAL